MVISWLTKMASELSLRMKLKLCVSCSCLFISWIILLLLLKGFLNLQTTVKNARMQMFFFYRIFFSAFSCFDVLQYISFHLMDIR